MQLVALRGGVGGLLMTAHEIDAVGADHADLFPGSFQHALDHVGGGGLALGAGHADHGHLAGGVAKEVGAHQSHGIAAAFHLHHGHARHGGQVDVVLDDQCADALGGAVGGKLVAVALGAHDAHEQQARGRLAAVINDVVDLGLRAALHQCVRHALHQLFQFHTVYAPPKH